MAAFRRAVVLGAEMIEADIRSTADGRLVALHDATVDRTTDGTGSVGRMRFEELRRLDAGAYFHPRFAGEHVPALDELFALADQTGVSLCLEAKGDRPGEAREVALAIAGWIARAADPRRHVLAGFDHNALAAAHAMYPGTTLAPDRFPERGSVSSAALVAQAAGLGAPIIQHHWADLRPELVRDVHAAGVAIWAWPPTLPTDIEAAWAKGADALMGDDVKAIVDCVAVARGTVQI